MKKPLIFCLLAALVGLSLAFSPVSFAQAKKKGAPKKKNTAGAKPGIATGRPIAVLQEGGIGGGSGMIEMPKYLSVEPCGKETPEQIAEIENAKDSERQVQILTDRLADKDEWTRGCAVYRLGQFKQLSSPALPLIIKLLRDDETDGMFHLASEAIYKIPPPAALRLQDLKQMAKDPNAYTRVYGLWALGYYHYISGSLELKDTVDALIEGTRDEDLTVRWIAVNGISRIGFAARAAVSALVELLEKKNMNSRNIILALGGMGQYMLPAAPILFDILYHPEKYTSDRTQRSIIYLTAAITLAQLGKELIPLLEKEFDKEPYAVLEVAQYMPDGDITPVLIKGLKHPDKDVREKSMSSLYSYNAQTAVKVLPLITELLKDVDPDIRKAAVSKVGSIVRSDEKNSPELTALLKKKALPALIKALKDKDKEVVCYAAFAIGNFAADAETAVPVLVRMMRQKDAYPNNCAQNALFDIGEKGRKFLSREKIKVLEDSKRSNEDLFKYFDRDKVKPITPKPAPTVKKVPDSY